MLKLPAAPPPVAKRAYISAAVLLLPLDLPDDAMTTTYKYLRTTKTTKDNATAVNVVDEITEAWEPSQLAAKHSLDVAVPTTITGPGTFAQDANGSLLSMDANSVYLDGRQMKSVINGKLSPLAASKITIVGRSIFAKGKTNPDWWSWTGSGWTGPITDGDPSILN
jgi:hypothetical protein